MNVIRFYLLVPILVVLLSYAHCNENEELSCQNLKECFHALQKEFEILKEEVRELKSDGASRSVEKRFVADGERDIEATVTKLEKDVKTLVEGIGSTYVRWGRTTCPGNTTEVYKGFMGGNVYTDNGGPANYLCLPEDPTWAKYQDGFQGEGNKIYGSEYQIIRTNFNPFHQDMNDEDIPCVVCSTKRPLNIMVPARTSCYNGWHLEYTGYLMTIWSGHPAAGEYVCVDSHPELIPHGSANTNGNVLYLVEAACGTLPCLPYVDGRELACSVCSK